LVKPGFVLAGLHIINPAALLTGISAWATLELNGPTTPMTVGSFARVWMFFAPCCGLCTPFTASSCWLMVIVNPGTGFLAIASATPFAGRDAVRGLAAGHRQLDPDLDGDAAGSSAGWSARGCRAGGAAALAGLRHWREPPRWRRAPWSRCCCRRTPRLRR